MPRRQPPHPARTIRPAPCPTGRPRFATRWLALAAIPIGWPAPISPAHCPHCPDWHHNTQETP